MKFAYERRFAAVHNRDKIVKNICDKVIADAEHSLDKAEEAGLMSCNVKLPDYPAVFAENVKNFLYGFFETWGYHVEWLGKDLIHISYDGE